MKWYLKRSHFNIEVFAEPDIQNLKMEKSKEETLEIYPNSLILEIRKRYD